MVEIIKIHLKRQYFLPFDDGDVATTIKTEGFMYFPRGFITSNFYAFCVSASRNYLFNNSHDI
jgi:hypothetical protein